MHKRSLCCDVLSVCQSVRLSVTFVYSVETNKRYLQKLSPSGNHTILVFPYQTLWQYFDGDSLTTASNAGGIGKNRDSRPVSGFIACCQRYDGPDVCITLGGRTVRPPSVIRTAAAPNRGKLLTLIAGKTDDEVFMTSFNVTPKTTEHNLIVRSFKSEAITTITRGQSNLTKSASRGAHSPVRGHPRGSKFVPLNSWGRVSY